MKERPKNSAFLLIALAFLCLYLVKSYSSSLRFSSSTAQVSSGKLDGPGARLVYGVKLDINSATAKELELLPGIGAVLGARIVQSRSVNGGFKKVNDLARVKGISPKRVLALSPYITVGG